MSGQGEVRRPIAERNLPDPAPTSKNETVARIEESQNPFRQWIPFPLFPGRR